MAELKEVLAKYGFSFKKQFGQNFIADGNLLRAIAADAGVDENTTVLEIGPGAGTLTRELSACAKKVVAYEIDRTLQPILDETLADCSNVQVIYGDFAKANLPELEKQLGEYIVVANLPYYVTTPVVMRFAEEAKKCKRLTVMVQEEVAERFCAQAGSSQYGAVTAALARVGECRITRKVSRNLFTPRPNVDSAVVRLDFIPNKIPVLSEKAYRFAVRCAFLNRRKTLENNVMHACRISREQAKELLAQANIEGHVRGETLSPHDLARLSDLLFQQGYIK